MRKSTGNPYFFTPKSAFFSCRGCCLHRQDWKGQVLCAPAARLATGHWTQWFLKNEGKVITRYTEEIIETMGLKTWTFLYGVMRHSILHMVFTEEIIENTEGLWYEMEQMGINIWTLRFFPVLDGTSIVLKFPQGALGLWHALSAVHWAARRRKLSWHRSRQMVTTKRRTWNQQEIQDPIDPIHGLVGGLEHFFQRSWNHQPVEVRSKYHISGHMLPGSSPKFRPKN